MVGNTDTRCQQGRLAYCSPLLTTSNIRFQELTIQSEQEENHCLHMRYARTRTGPGVQDHIGHCRWPHCLQPSSHACATIANDDSSICNDCPFSVMQWRIYSASAGDPRGFSLCHAIVRSGYIMPADGLEWPFHQPVSSQPEIIWC